MAFIRKRAEFLMKKLSENLKVHTTSSGITLIELLIIVAVISITLTMAIPTYSNYLIRSRIGEALSLSTAVKSAAASACQEDRTNAFLTNRLVSYNFQASKYARNIVLSGTCHAPTITLTTRATGTQPNPVLTITGEFADDTEQITWTCVSSGLKIHAPEACRK
jgi:type IV pilus assembly protein PilA